MSQTTARGVDHRERLGFGPATVGDATAGLGVSKPAITKHVKVLEEISVVTRGRGPHARPVTRARRAPRGGRVDGSPADRLGRFLDVVDEHLKEEGAK